MEVFGHQNGSEWNGYHRTRCYLHPCRGGDSGDRWANRHSTR
ncbi:MAG: hypothetical protein H0X65_15860 [Gemmatimonadetes bacterium]|nr:hypothetical protein [Gemmatimonadota bacterium]